MIGPEYPRDSAYGRTIPADKRYTFKSWKSPVNGGLTIQDWECGQVMQAVFDYTIADAAKRGMSPFTLGYWEAVEAEARREASH